MSYLTVQLNTNHKKKDFDCGKPLLNSYLYYQAKQDVKKRLSACFILEDKDNYIKGYYTLSSSSINKALVPGDILKKMPPAYHHLPVTLLGRLAVDNSYKGQGLGELILLDALKRSFENSLTIGSIAVVVNPLDEDAIKFYAKYGFILLPDSGKMFIPMETIAAL
ncbi:GNAT family N-acetyltransferase [Chitinophaga defluvii]|uniref:GNAT family N-acetyltransferase n=1 Tax=Chitinophaga defluvii TaxID=3163343 RepID=A0ABV2TC46_9BACT